MFIFSNLAISIDGKISTRSRNLFHLGTPEDRRQMQVLRKKCDAVLVGASTLRCFKKPCLALGAERQPVNLLISSTLHRISPHWPFFQKKDLARILFVGPETPMQKVRTFQKCSEVILLRKPTSRNSLAQQIIAILKNKGIQNLLIEGGGEIMWEFVQSNLIDEYHVTLTPKIIGGTRSPTLVDGQGFLSNKILNLKLKECRVVADELYLTYAKKRRKVL